MSGSEVMTMPPAPVSETDEDSRLKAIRNAAAGVFMPPAGLAPQPPANTGAPASVMPPAPIMGAFAPPARTSATMPPAPFTSTPAQPERTAAPSAMPAAPVATPKPVPTAEETARTSLSVGRMPAAPINPAGEPPIPGGYTVPGYPNGEPQLHGWRKALDVIGSMFPIGREIETAIPGTPQNYSMRADVANERFNQAAIRAATQFNTPEKRREYVEKNPDLLDGVSDFEKNDFILSGKTPQREPEPGKTPEEATLHDLMTGGENGQPRINPDTNKPYTYLEAYAAEKAASQGAKEPPLGENVAALNAAMTDRYHILNPGKPLPAEFTLPANATAKDYDRIDKAMEAVERAQGTKAQQDTANAIRNQSAQLAQQNAKDKEATEGLQPVIGRDPKTGADVLVSAAEAKKMGLENPMKADAADVTKALSARHWIPLADKKGDTPESMGILQLVNKLDKEGKLGPLASRWNDFMAGKYGAGDPEYTALRTKMGLSTTLLMNVHVGNRGGSYMLEHFEDLANAKKMDANTLRTGVKSELDYVKDRAMMPGTQSGAALPPGFAEWKSKQGR